VQIVFVSNSGPTKEEQSNLLSLYPGIGCDRSLDIEDPVLVREWLQTLLESFLRAFWTRSVAKDLQGAELTDSGKDIPR
jgi:hypothetical protein